MDFVRNAKAVPFWVDFVRNAKAMPTRIINISAGRRDYEFRNRGEE